MENLVEQALWTAITQDAGITAYTNECYVDIAPASASDPFIIIALNAGNYLRDNANDASDLIYLVKAVSTTQQTADSIAAALYSLLHETPLSLSGGVWTNYRTQIAQPVRMTELVERVQYFHRGYLIRIRSSK